MKSIVSNQPPVTLQADREHDNSHFGWILPRTLDKWAKRSMARSVHAAGANIDSRDVLPRKQFRNQVSYAFLVWSAFEMSEASRTVEPLTRRRILAARQRITMTMERRGCRLPCTASPLETTTYSHVALENLVCPQGSHTQRDPSQT